MNYKSIWFLLTVLIFSCYQSHTKAIQYPDTRKDESVTDTYFGTEVADPTAGWKMIIALKPQIG